MQASDIEQPVVQCLITILTDTMTKKNLCIMFQTRFSNHKGNGFPNFFFAFVLAMDMWGLHNPHQEETFMNLYDEKFPFMFDFAIQLDKIPTSRPRLLIISLVFVSCEMVARERY